MRRRFNSTRWQTWDYGWDGIYFITICTHNRVPYFGFIENGKMQLSDIGEEAELCVKNIPSHFPFARVSAFVVMPNHLHLLLITDKMGVFNESELTRFFEPINFESKKKDVVSSVIEGNEHVGAQNLAHHKPQFQMQYMPTSLKNMYLNIPVFSRPHEEKNRFGVQSQNVASIVRGLKVGVTKFARNHLHYFKWQARYHDHVVRNRAEYVKIKAYIESNVRNWNSDKFYEV